MATPDGTAPGYSGNRSMTGPGGMSRAVGLFHSASAGGTGPVRRTSVRLRWRGSDCACAACASVARSGGIAAGHTRERRTAVRRDESLNGAGDVDNAFLQDNDFTLYYVVRRAFVTRLYRNRLPQLPLWELGDRE